ncbi:MAG: hydroxysqualene dehydroxylase HpnE [Pseudomonadota bacterium]
MCAASTRKSAIVVGAGWSGCAAAVELARAGWKVTLLEAAREVGGRARVVQAHGRSLDNGQHIMLGAYTESFRLMKIVGVDLGPAMLNLPLQMRYPPGSGGMDFVAPRLPAPLHLGIALLRAKGLERADKMALARFSTTARWMDWQLYHDCSVSELLERFDQTARLTKLMWRPLCLAALNTPPERASAQVFMNVLRDSLGAKRASSDMLLPRLDLSALFPAAAGRFVTQRGGAVLSGTKAHSLTRTSQGWQVAASGDWNASADAVVLATPAPGAATLLAPLAEPALLAQLAAFEYEAITTCYLQYASATTLALPFYALIDDEFAGHWGQFVFDRGQLDQRQGGLLAVVISASHAASALGQPALASAVAAQLALVFGRPELATPLSVQVITEKRATFACSPGLQRPPCNIGIAGLALAGDYTASDYPATLEAAVRSGSTAAKYLLES